MADLSLIDLITPYVLRGGGFGAWHPALAVLAVYEHEVALSAEGVVIRGVVRFTGDIQPYIDPDRMVIGVESSNQEGHPLNDPGRRSPWIDVRDAKIEFQLTVPRVASAIVAQAVTNIGVDAAFAGAAAVLNQFDINPNDAPPSDFPNTEFTLDFLLTTIVLRPPFLRGAKREADGQLVPDPSNEQVKLTLPKIKMRLMQGSAVGSPLSAVLLSAGASGLDDPGDLSVAELITMDPPYAFIGPSNVVGFGFRSAVLDLSNGSTPPQVLEQFGYDESWTGIYLPEIRLFVAPNGARDLAVEGGARNLLIGIGQSAGVTGDFDLQVLNQGAGPLKLGARFYDATGRSYGLTRTSESEGTVQLPARTRMIIDVDGGRTPIMTSATFDGGAAQNGREHDIDLSSATQRNIVLQATDTSAPPRAASMTVRVSRLSAPALPPAGSQPEAQNSAVDLQTTSVTQGGVAVSAPRLRLVSETPTTATIALDRPGNPTWTVGGVPAGTSSTVTVDVAPGATVNVRAELPGTASAGSFTAYYRFDHPEPQEGSDYATNPSNSRTEPAPDEGASSNWFGGSDSITALRGALVGVPNHAAVRIEGFASFEGPDTAQTRTYNTALAQRRADGLRAMIERVVSDGQTPALAGRTYDFTPAPAANMTAWTTQGTSLATRRQYWKAVASWSPAPAAGTITEGTVSRRSNSGGGTDPIPVPDPAPASPPPQPPSWFRQLGAKVRIVRNQFVACEVFGKFDFQTASENRLREGAGPGTELPTWEGLGSQNPADGLVDLRVVVQIDDATDTVTVTGYFGADPADRDGLALLGTRPNQPPDPGPKNFGLDFFGTSCVFLPLIAEGAGAVANEGALAELAVTAGGLGLCAVIAGLGWMRTERIIWYGGELAVVANARGEWTTTLLFDIETAISADFLGLVKIARNAPLVVRYKAIGILFGSPPGQPAFQFRPMFDSSKGYSIDLSRPGAIEVAEPLGQILQILGARIARNNPMIIEVDLGFAIDLGVVSIERARVRVTLNESPSVELTAFGAGIDIPGALRGRGYMELSETEIKGQIDLTIVPVSVRVAAGVGVAQIPAAQGGPATGVIVSLYVEFPVAIPLGASGLGIYGFLGLFAMHYARNEDEIDAGNQAPALAWLKATGGNPTDLQFWKPKINNWAFGVGAILGTMGSSVIFNLKGMLMLELPGPRLLLMMKAKLLAEMPSLGGTGEGLLFAVIDLDMGRGTLTIGISVEFKVEPLLRIRIPVEAFFNFHDSSDWHLYLGKYEDQIQADILSVFEGSGYLMLSGNGISGIQGLPAVTGFSIATGLHVAFIWGSKPARLYAELAAGFDAIVGFDPFRFAGILYVRGSLNLWIISISAWANLNVDIGEDATGQEISRIWGEICGKIDFFFFSISGCVDFAIGDNSVPVPNPPALVRSLKLISRSPALVLGTGTDRPIDGGLGEAKEGAAVPADLPVVPIDSIPALMFSAPPLAPGVEFRSTPLNSTSEAPADGWVLRGDTAFKYTLKAVELSGPLTAGSTPATWWKQKSGDTALEAQLALLSWVPEATPKAIEYSKFLEETVKENWGTVCSPAAPPTPVLWTFLDEILGPSPFGWWLDGRAWPDPPGTVRSMATPLVLRVTEAWRSGDPKLDQMRGVVPASVQGLAVNCLRTAGAPTAGGVASGALSVAASSALPSAAVGALSSAAVGALSTGAVAVSSAVTALPVLAATAPQRLPIIESARGVRRRDSLPVGNLTITDVLRQLNSGTALSRAALHAVAIAAPNDPATPAGEPKACDSRVLAAPLYDDFMRFRRNPETRRQVELLERLKRLEYRPGPLIDAVVFHTSQIEYATFYLFVHRLALTEAELVIADANAAGDLFNEHVIRLADTVPGVPYPARWIDAGGPWLPDIYKLVQHSIFLQERGYVAVIVQLKGHPAADRVQIGFRSITPEIEKHLTAVPYYVAAVEGLRRSEVERFDYDQTQQTKKQGAAGGVLGGDTSDYALLEKGTTYSVTVTWDAERERRPAGAPATDHKTITGQQQTFWFKTDPNPPARLDPWVLMSLPEDNEKHFFSLSGIRLVFATNNVVRLYETYGKRLQVRLKAASFHAPPSTAAVPHPFQLNATTVLPVAKSVLDPFEAALEKVLDGSCVPSSGSRIRHSKVDIPIPLDRYTDYILDVEMVDADAPESAKGPSIYRRAFSTGAFESLIEFAESFFVARVKHRAAPVGALQAIAAKYASAGRSPQGSELDSDFIAAGLEAPELAKEPRLIVFWEGGANPQPAAVLLDASEPLWRSRLIPREIVDPTPAANKRYELLPVPWLEPAEQPGGNAIVQHIVAAPGGQRALISLAPNARGKHLRLALKQVAQKEPYLDGPSATDQFATVADLILSRAPWEEEE
ncbi:MAG TPA: hypothetical protein VFQ61_16545 [Polyangiaceae bacterium]|nr:hypothetical protein [Polyangiaceae bacterium]